jgi:hypothetical protein
MPKPRAEDQSERERREGVPSKPQKWNLGLRPERGVIPSFAPFLVNPTNTHNTQESTLLPDTAFSAEYQAMFQPLPEDSIDPPPPQPLLFLPFMVNNRVVHALLDSGASDCFISETLVAELRLPRKRLKQPMSVRVASGTSLSVDYGVRVAAMLGKMSVRLFLRVLPTPIPVVLGYTFLHRHQPSVDWRKSEVQITRSGITYVIPALPLFEVFRLSGWLKNPQVATL